MEFNLDNNSNNNDNINIEYRILSWMPVKTKLDYGKIKSYKCPYCDNRLTEYNDKLICEECSSVFKIFNNEIFEAIVRIGRDGNV